MSTTVNTNSAIPSSLVEDGQAFYDSYLKSLLEPDHSGEFIAIEPLASRYFLGQTATAALVAARKANARKAVLPHPRSQKFSA